MAKSITYFDREHTGGINLAAMEDTQLKENLVQDVATGGDEAPTATAVKEAVDAKMDKADIVNDLTTGGTDKALSAEQGKVLEDKKVDKLTEANDLVYVHGSDGTESGKALSEFVVDTDIVNDRASGGTDKVLAADVGTYIPAFFELPLTKEAAPLTSATIDYTKYTDKVISPALLFVHPDEIPEEIKSKLKRGDIVSTLDVGTPLSRVIAIYRGVSSNGSTDTNATAAVVNTSLPAEGNWNDWYMFTTFINSQDQVFINSRTNYYYIGLADGETLDTLPSSTDVITGGYSLSSLFVKKEDIKKANGSPYGQPTCDGDQLKVGDIVSVNPTSSASKRFYTCVGTVARLVDDGYDTLNPGIINTSLPPSGNWNGYYQIQLIASGFDRIAMLSKTDSTKMQNYLITWNKEGETWKTLPDLSTYNSDKGVSSSTLYVHPDDISSITGSIKRGDIVTFAGTSESGGKVMGHIEAMYKDIVGKNVPLPPSILNESLPESGSYEGWYRFIVMSSLFDNKQMSNKMQHYRTELQSTGKTWPTMPDARSNVASGLISGVVYIHPDDIPDISDKIKEGDTLNCVTTKTDSTGKYLYNMTLKYYRVGTATDKLNTAILNNALPAEGSFEGWLRFYTLATGYDREAVKKKVTFYRMVTTEANSNILGGVRIGTNTVIFKNGVDTDSFAKAIQRGDMIEVANESGNLLYVLEFIGFVQSDNVNAKHYVIGQDTIPEVPTGYLMCKVIVNNVVGEGMAVYRTDRYKANQFTVGAKYKLRTNLSGSDTLAMSGLTGYMTPANANQRRLVAYTTLSPGSMIRFVFSDGEAYFKIETSTTIGDMSLAAPDITCTCISKGATDVTDLTGA